jgi:hypothetical protein
MSYLQQILGGAQQRGGLTDDEFNSIFQQFMPQQQAQPNMGLPQQPVQRAQMLPQTQAPMAYGTGLNTTQFGKTKSVGDDGADFLDLMNTSVKYDTDFGSDQSRMLAEQDNEFNDGLMSLFR